MSLFLYSQKPDKIVQLNKNEKKETSDKGKSGQNKVKEKKAAEKKAPEKKAAEKKASEKKAPENSKEKPAPKKEAESEEDSGSETDVPGDSSEGSFCLASRWYFSTDFLFNWTEYVGAL